ncbi:MAG: transcription antitermination factor NusB, partial [Planctomycetota bacterium]
MSEPSHRSPDRRRRRPIRALPPSGRAAALDWLALQADRFPQLAIGDPNTRGLDARDAAFARSLSEMTIRRWFTSKWLAEQFTERPLHLAPPKLRAALLAGVTQVAFMDGVADHAAIFETVEWTKARLKPRAGGVVNAVLRRVTEALGTPVQDELGPQRSNQNEQIFDPSSLPRSDGSRLPLNGLQLPSDPLEALSIATSCPISLLRRWSGSRSERACASLAWHGLVRAPTIVRVGDADLAEDRSLVAPHDATGHAVWNGQPGELAPFLGRHRDVWIQDAAASEPVASVADLAPGLIIDVCAGNGTKTRQLAATFPNARILASDVDADRLRTLAAAFEHDDRVEVVAADQLLDRAVGTADLVLLDVPCSNTGVLARRVEARYRLTKKSLQRLLDVQRQIIADALRLL